jgi:hypothetical protein
MKVYRCPLCKSKLSKERYEQVLNIQREQKIAQQEELAKAHKIIHQAQRAQAELKSKLRELKQKAKELRAEGIRQGSLKEKQRQERLTAGLKKKVVVLQERIRQLEKGTTPQTEGLEFEVNLCRRLQKEFPEDRIEHKGKGGDILHFVIFRKGVAGIIVYECKRTPKIMPAHIQQTALAKSTRGAHFAILITTGTKKRFAGLTKEDDVLIVAPLGVIPLAHLCRGHLVEMEKAKLDNEQKNRVASQMLSFITSPICKVPLEQAIQQAERAQKVLNKEAVEHFHLWNERFKIYQTIYWDIDAVRSNINRVLNGEKPKLLERTKIERFLPPARTEG